MIRKFCAEVLLVAHLAHNENLWTIFLDVLVKLTPCHMLVLFSVAYVAPEFGAVKLSMCLELVQGFPNYFTSTIVGEALVGKFTEVNTIFEDFVNVLHEVVAFTTVWAAKVFSSWFDSVVLFSSSTNQLLLHSSHKTTHTTSILIDDTTLITNTLPQLKLTVFTKQLIALSALKWFVWELEADHALNFFNHFTLKFVLNFIHLDV